MYEILVGLNVIDNFQYQEYRKNMMPILESYRGGFNYDFIVSDVLKSQTENIINRVFTIYFPNKKTSERFFSNSEYLEIKKKHYEISVDFTTILSRCIT